VTRIIVFAKAPVPGQAKTRLMPRLGPEGAAALHARMVERMVAIARGSDIGPVELAVTPDIDVPFFREIAGTHGVALASQGPGDLGERMWRALERAINEEGSGIIVGTDSPGVDGDTLRAAATALADGPPVVVAPAEDGGYVLIGARARCPGLFEGVAWGTDAVMGETRSALVRGGLRARELPTLWDVDRPEDYERLCREFPELADPMGPTIINRGSVRGAATPGGVP